MDGALAFFRAWLELVDLENRLEAEFLRRGRESDHVMRELLMIALERARAERAALEKRARAALLAQVEVHSTDSLRKP